MVKWIRQYPVVLFCGHLHMLFEGTIELFVAIISTFVTNNSSSHG